MELQYDKDGQERIPYEHYLQLFQSADPLEMSQRSGIPYDSEKQIFTLQLMGVTYDIKYPEYMVSHREEEVICYYPLESAVNARILVLRYLVEGCKSFSTGKFLTLSGNTLGEMFI